MPYGFQDELARLRAEAGREDDQAERRAAYQRMLDYRAGVGIAADLTGRVATFGTNAADKAATLRTAARQQPNTLEGRVASSELGEAAVLYGVEAERQRPQREVDAAYIARARELWNRHYAAAAREREGWDRQR